MTRPPHPASRLGPSARSFQGRLRTGFTLLEIIMAVTILSFAIIPMSMFMRTGSQTVEGTRDLAGAVLFAQKTLEQCRSFRYERLHRDASVPADEETAEEAMTRENKFTLGKLTYTRQVSIRPLSAGSGFEGRIMHLKINWQRRPDEKPLEYEVWTAFSPIK